MKRFAITLAFLLSAVAVINAQLLYRISGGGLNEPSYIIGTYHLAPASFVDSIPGAGEALAAVEQVCGELDMRDLESPENRQKLQQAMLLPGDSTLKDVFTPEEWENLNSYTKRIVGVGIDNPMLAKMQPFALATQLQLVQYMKMTPGFNPVALIDSYFQTKASQSGKAVIGFETIEFQMEVLYGKDLERQKQSIFCMIDNEEYTFEMMKNLTAAYFSQDLAALQQITEEKMGNSCDSTPEEDEALIYSRNAAWVEKIPAIAGENATLFVVGAAHLPGERGVLELLEQAGYTIEAVK